MIESLVRHLVTSVTSKPAVVQVELVGANCHIRIATQDLPRIVNGEHRVLKSIKTITHLLAPGACNDLIIEPV